MTYVEKYADIKFKLPDLPHLPPEMHADYYKVLTILFEIYPNSQYSKRK